MPIDATEPIKVYCPVPHTTTSFVLTAQTRLAAIIALTLHMIEEHPAELIILKGSLELFGDDFETAPRIAIGGA